MVYKIIADSCCDLTDKYRKDPHFQIIPLTLQVGSHSFIDDETFDQKEYIRLVAESPECARTACPSPEAYMKAFEGEADMVFIVTLSQHLSGSYNSAVLGKTLYEEEHGTEKKIHVFSSDSACCGESLIAFKIQELAEAGASFEQIVARVNEFRDHIQTYFVLEDLDTLKKNGRLTGLAAILASALNIKPIMAGDHGVIVKVDQCRGIQKALKQMVEHFMAGCRNPESRTLGITHVNCPERAEQVKKMFLSQARFKNVYVVDAAGVSTTYANNGGIVVCA